MFFQQLQCLDPGAGLSYHDKFGPQLAQPLPQLIAQYLLVLCENCGRWAHKNSAASAFELNEERTDVAAADVFDLVRLRIAPEYGADRDITVNLNFAVRRFDADFAGRQEHSEMCRMRMHSITTDPIPGRPLYSSTRNLSFSNAT